jgi:hypothetical protein
MMARKKDIKRMLSDEVIYEVELEYIRDQLLALKYIFRYTVLAIIVVLLIIIFLFLHYRGICLC